MSVVQVTTKGQADICGLDCHQTPCGYLRAMLVEGDMMISQTATLPREAIGITRPSLLPGAIAGSMVLWKL